MSELLHSQLILSSVTITAITSCYNAKGIPNKYVDCLNQQHILNCLDRVIPASPCGTIKATSFVSYLVMLALRFSPITKTTIPPTSGKVSVTISQIISTSSFL